MHAEFWLVATIFMAKKKIVSAKQMMDCNLLLPGRNRTRVALKITFFK